MRDHKGLTPLTEPGFTHRFILFVDFDGTITKKDIGANIFLRFGSHPEVEYIVEDIRCGNISAMQGWERLFAAAPDLSLPAVEEFVRGFEIDQTFISFAGFSSSRGYPLYILSDGFDTYIRLILEREGLSHLPFYSNSLTTALGAVMPVFPYTDSECIKCANCKRNHILNNSDDEAITFYIGNGSSDTCPAQYCDYIFAKDDLLRYCEKERISFFPYDNFSDVTAKVTELAARRRPKKRHQAQIKRTDVYKAG
jgi:2,3-diketo-5-methylthio-1-phosphopentane phosphatase